MLSRAKHPSDSDSDFDTEIAEVGKRSQRERSHPIKLTTDFTDGRGCRGVTLRATIPVSNLRLNFDPVEPGPFLPQITQMAQIPNQEDRFYLRTSATSAVKNSRIELAPISEH
jgi:hypothetical protein